MMEAQTPVWLMFVIPLILLFVLPFLALLVAGIVHRPTRPWAHLALVGLVVGGGLAVGWTQISVRPGAPVIEHLNNGEQWHDHYTQPTVVDHSYTSHSRSVSFGIPLVGPVLMAALLLGIVALFRHARGPAAVLAIVLIPLCGIFFLRGSYHREVYSGSDATVNEVPLEVHSYTVQATETPIKLAEEDPDDAAAYAAAGEALVEMVEANEAATEGKPPAAGEEAQALADTGAHEGVATEQLAEALDPDPAPTPATSPEKLPDWVHQPIKRIGELTRRVVSEGPHVTADEAQRRVQPKIENEVHSYLRDVVTEQVGRPVAVPHLRELGITPRWIRENVVAEEHYASIDTSVQEDMQTIHVLLEFGPRQTDLMVEKWQDHARQSRVSLFGAAAGGVLAMLGGVWGLLKIDTATKGYYTKRLFIGVPLAIIGGLALLGLMVA